MSRRRPTPEAAWDDAREALIPAALRAMDRWVGWRYGRKGDRPKPPKIPINPRNGRRASVTNPGTWGRFIDAVGIRRALGLEGLGFVLGDGIAGADLDGVLDAVSGEMHPWADDILQELGTYSEISPSGTGVKAFLRGRLVEGLKHRYGTNPHIELYDCRRFFTVTALRLPGFPVSVEDRQEALLRLHRRLHESAQHVRRVTARHADAVAGGLGAALSDAELLAKAGAARNGEKFARLWRGDDSGYRSPSEADCALAGLLLFWTGGDVERTADLMRRSGLMREKYDRPDYLPRTIRRALRGTPLFYQGGADIPLRGARASAGHSPSADKNTQPCDYVFKNDNTPLDWAWAMATSSPLPTAIPSFDNHRVRLLAAVCYYLQRRKCGEPFGISTRQAADRLGVSQAAAVKYFRRLKDAGFIEEHARGTYLSRKATQYVCPAAR
jgi:putative DNA primase/helicase